MPNILITGTPGTGKTTLAAAIASAHPQMRHVELSKLIGTQELYESKDEHFDTLIFDDDKVVDYLEDVMDIHKHRNTIVDFHTSDFFPERWFDLVIVLRTSAGPHYERLAQKGYSEHKITENVDAEIFQVCLDEALDSYHSSIIKELPSDTVDQMDENIEWVNSWLSTWTPDMTPAPSHSHQAHEGYGYSEDDAVI